jgi:Ca2+-binding EF-hand superfamily protein
MFSDFINFNCTGIRAKELFNALDGDGDGVLTEEEFVQVTVNFNL